MGPQGIGTQAEADVKEPSQSSGVLQFSTAEITNVLEKKNPTNFTFLCQIITKSCLQITNRKKKEELFC